MQADCMAQLVLQPRRRTGDVRQMPFGAQLRGRDHPRSGADDMCACSGRLRVFEGARYRQVWAASGTSGCSYSAGAGSSTRSPMTQRVSVTHARGGSETHSSAATQSAASIPPSSTLEPPPASVTSSPSLSGTACPSVRSKEIVPVSGVQVVRSAGHTNKTSSPRSSRKTQSSVIRRVPWISASAPEPAPGTTESGPHGWPGFETVGSATPAVPVSSVSSPHAAAARAAVRTTATPVRRQRYGQTSRFMHI